jgi:hypothetical protein
MEEGTDKNREGGREGGRAYRVDDLKDDLVVEGVDVLHVLRLHQVFQLGLVQGLGKRGREGGREGGW